MHLDKCFVHAHKSRREDEDLYRLHQGMRSRRF